MQKSSDPREEGALRLVFTPDFRINFRGIFLPQWRLRDVMSLF